MDSAIRMMRTSISGLMNEYSHQPTRLFSLRNGRPLTDYKRVLQMIIRLSLAGPVQSDTRTHACYWLIILFHNAWSGKLLLSAAAASSRSHNEQRAYEICAIGIQEDCTLVRYRRRYVELAPSDLQAVEAPCAGPRADVGINENVDRTNKQVRRTSEQSENNKQKTVRTTSIVTRNYCRSAVELVTVQDESCFSRSLYIPTSLQERT